MTKKISILFSGLLAFALAGKAQSTDGANPAPDSLQRHTIQHRDFRGQPHAFRQPGGGEFRRFGPHIQLTADQKQQMKSISADYHKQSAELFANDKLTLGEYKSRLLTLEKDRKAKMQGLLTRQQKDELAQWKKKKAEKQQSMAATHLDRLKTRLNLSDEQLNSIKSGQAGLREQLQAIRDNDELLPRQKREQLKTLVLKRKEIIESVLTPEQKTKLQEMPHRHSFGRDGQDRGQNPGGPDTGK